eukprot:TRINITY_DN1162_c0_g1_i2.p2 TRINITY_DN1162_c0_g1~~TRINITY_DN1162_c0_g1_i2.p2  ORF type:complete len:176 (-),score=98.47 TRINITY_DN1162_c0_g1_i2:72-599(-)
MHHTHFADDVRELVPNFVRAYMPRHGSSPSDSATRRFRLAPTSLDLVDDGGVVTTLGDLLLWDENFYTHKVGGSVLIESLLAPGLFRNGTHIVDPEFGHASTYALGLTVTDRFSERHPLRAVLHAGTFVGWRAQLVRFPEQHTSFAVLCNGGRHTPADQFANEIAELYFDVVGVD